MVSRLARDALLWTGRDVRWYDRRLCNNVNVHLTQDSALNDILLSDSLCSAYSSTCAAVCRSQVSQDCDWSNGKCLLGKWWTRVPTIIALLRLGCLEPRDNIVHANN